jgi:ABC-type sulfate transport system permease component
VHVDPMGKALAQQLLDFPIAVPDQIASQITRPS